MSHTIVCPHCSNVITTEISNKSDAEDCDGEDIICHHCGKEFMININWSWSISTVKIEENATI
jgi:hypothetical protein